MAKNERDVWVRRVRAWKRSGQSARVYGEEIGVSAQALWRWSSKLEAEESEKRPAKRPEKFVELTAREPSEVGSLQLEVDGVIVRIGHDLDVEKIAALVRALGTRQ